MFTLAERAILVFQAEVLEKVDSGNAQMWRTYGAIFAEGYTSQYTYALQNIRENELDTKIQEEVFSILDMYRALNLCEQNHGWKSGETYAKFQGFDGNHESQWFGFAKFLLETMNLYKESQMAGGVHTLGKYRPMLNEWDNFGRNTKLSPVEADQIVKA